MRAVHLSPKALVALAGLSLAALLLALPAASVLAGYLFHSTFTTGIDGWDVGQWGGAATWTTASGQLCVTLTNPGGNPWEVSIYRRGVNLQAGHTYTLAFDVSASQNATIQAHLQHNGAPYTQYWQKTGLAAGAAPQTISESFTNTYGDDDNVEMTFQAGNGGGNAVAAGTVICLDNISLDDPAYSPIPTPTTYPVKVNQLGYFPGGAKESTVRSDAAEPLPWQLKNAADAVVLAGQSVPLPGTDAASGEKVHLVDFSTYQAAGDGYTLKIDRPGAVLASGIFDSGLAPWGAWFSSPAAGSASVVNGEACLNVTAGGANVWDIGLNFQQFALKKGQNYTVTFKAHASAPTQLRAKIGEVGGSWAEYWSNTVAFTDQTQVTTQGNFTLAGDPPAQVTFDFNFGGTLAGVAPFTVCLDDIRLAETSITETSHPFKIGGDLYQNLKRDALRYFYYSRSGTAIEMPYAQDARWARAAGPADTSVGCVPGNPGCTYSYLLNVSKGWYDAGDYGKYVVNGGLAAWTLMNAFERAQYFGNGRAFGEELNIPESGNGVPDILDEARWEMEFLLSMQVPRGYPLEGMAHHKVHDIAWGPMPQAPDEDTAARYLHPPSTAATLNLAATGAQCARIFQRYDAAFAQRCLVAAERAWRAAMDHPNIYADPNDGAGGGTYSDQNVADEFYWANAELYITTGNANYWAHFKKSPYYLQISTAAGSERAANEVGQETSMTWGDTAALGTISLAVVPNKLDQAAITTARSNIAAAADIYLAIQAAQAYRVPMRPGAVGGYPWGSNSFLLNNGIVLALAHDFTGGAQYVDGVRQTMDYILGRNPLDHSFVTGYGANPTAHPHHRFWGNEGAYPPPPPGVVSGGPDSNLQDPMALALLPGCAYQKCYLDNRDSYSTNEVAINWNAPLAWVAAYLDEQR